MKVPELEGDTKESFLMQRTGSNPVGIKAVSDRGAEITSRCKATGPAATAAVTLAPETKSSL